MHPTTSYQIATLQAAEVRRRSELRNAHAPARRGTRISPVTSSTRSSLVHVRTLLATVFRPA